MTEKEEWSSLDEFDLKQLRKKTKKRSLIIAVFAVIIIFSVGIYLSFVGVSNLATGLCGNELLTKIQQPISGVYDLVEFKRDCGATTGFSYHLSIIKHGNELKNVSGNIYISNSEFTTQWIDKNTIIVGNVGQDQFKKINKFKGINIQYN